jgi:hypothetical protein
MAIQAKTEQAPSIKQTPINTLFMHANPIRPHRHFILLRASFLVLCFLTVHVNARAQCIPCESSGNTYTINAASSASYTLTTGQSLYISPSGVYTGTLVLSGGSVCNAGVFSPNNFTFTDGTLTNTATATIANALTFAEGTLNNCGEGKITFAGLSNTTVLKGTVNNWGLMIFEGHVDKSGILNNEGKFSCHNLSSTGPIYNSCTIDIKNNFSNKSLVYGGENATGVFRVAGVSDNKSVFGVSGELDFCDSSSSNGGRFDYQYGTVGQDEEESNISYCTRAASGCALAIPVVTLIADPLVVPTQTCSQLIAQVESGFPPYQYRWNGGTPSNSDTFQVCPTANTTYTLVVTDFAGTAITQTIRVLLALEVNASIITPTEQNLTSGSIALTVSGGKAPYQFLWNDNSTESTRNNLAAGIYTVTVSDGETQTKQLTYYVGNRVSWLEGPTGSSLSASENGATLSRGTGNDWCAGHRRSNTIFDARTTAPTPNYWITCIVIDASRKSLIGLATVPNANAPQAENYRLFVNNDSLSVIEIDQDGFYTKRYLGAIADGDVLRMEMKPTGIFYYKNNILIHTTAVYASAIYRLEIDVFSGPSQITQIQSNAIYPASGNQNGG